MYYLHSLHRWSVEEMEGLRGPINQIGQQNASNITYEYRDYVFSIKGSDPKFQKQALIALSELLERKRPAQPSYPQKPYRDRGRETSPLNTPESPANGFSDLLIDLDDQGIAFFPNAASPRETEHSAEFHVDDRVRDPFEMYFADKKQKIDLPTLLADACGCVVKISKDGRTISVTSDKAVNTNRLLVQMEQMQEYFLRTPFRVDKVALVYGSNRDEFRLQFVPVQEHSFYSSHLETLPSSLARVNLRNCCVVEKAVFDASRATWVLLDGVRLPRISDPLSRPQVNTAVGNGAQRGRGSPQRAWSRGSSSSDQQSRSLPYGVGSRGSEWHEQESPTFGFGPTKERTLPSSWKVPAPGARAPLQSPSQTPWLSSAALSSSRPSASGVQPSQGTVRRIAQPEWAAQTFETRDESDFPSLSTTPKLSSRTAPKAGMPALPLQRRVESPNTVTGTSSPVPSLSRVESESGPLRTSSAGESIVFDEQEFAFLENIPGSRPRELDSKDLEQASLRDPVKEKEETQRTIRILPRQHASPVPSNPKQVTMQAAFINGMRKYNMRRLSESIRNGLRELRGRRKEIRLVGRLGCVLYPTDRFVLNQFWEYTQLESVIVQERAIHPVFSPMATSNNAHLINLYGFLGVPKAESAHFEIECDTRTNPTGRYVRTLVTVPSTVAILDRVVTPWETFGEVMWNAMDKHIDFEIILQAREGVIHDTKSALGRTDVKPFSTFRKKLSIGTLNSHITCHDVKGYLEVLNINFRETRTYEKPGEFTLVIHKIEELNPVRVQGLDTVTGRTGENGKKWYEFELYNETVNRKLHSNLTVIPGTMADWTVNDIVGDDPENSEELARMVRAMMLLVDECHGKFD